jgi:hypothetical protein
MSLDGDRASLAFDQEVPEGLSPGDVAAGQPMSSSKVY